MEILQDFWFIVFTGYPYVIAHDQGPQFTAEYFQVNCSQLGIVCKETPTESHNSLSLCERYHSIIRRVYNKMKNEYPNQDKHTRLNLAVHAVDNTTGPEGLTPTCLFSAQYQEYLCRTNHHCLQTKNLEWKL